MFIFLNTFNARKRENSAFIVYDSALILFGLNSLTREIKTIKEFFA